MVKDSDLVAGKQNYELDYFQKRFGIGRETMRKYVETVGHSRTKIMKALEKDLLIVKNSKGRYVKNEDRFENITL